MTVTATAIQQVLIDQKQPELLDHMGLDGAPVLRMPLVAGSINLIAHDGALLGIERLPAESLITAIRQHTLASRAAALKALTSWAYLVIVGSTSGDKRGKTVINDRPINWEWRSIQAALATVQELGVIVLECGHDDQLGDLLITLARRNRGPARVTPLREALFATPAELVLQALPGIGEEKAESLLDQCPGAAWALVSLTDPNHALPGIGPKTIANARQALGLRDNERLSIDVMN